MNVGGCGKSAAQTVAKVLDRGCRRLVPGDDKD